jgi:hypothetical protein
MLHAGLDLSRKRLDVCLVDDHAEVVEEFAAPPDVDGVGAFIQTGQAARVYSWIRPPSRSRRLTALLGVGATSVRAGCSGLGGLSSRLRCGRRAL